MKGLDKLVSEIRRSNLLDWREFNFFKAGVGLSRNDQLSIQACLDYELARECPWIVENAPYWSEKDRQDAIVKATSPYFLGHSTDKGRFYRFPKVCMAASWFPSPWLSAPASERNKIIKTLATLYDDTPDVSRKSPWLFAVPQLSARQKEACKQMRRLIEQIFAPGARTLGVFDFPIKDQKMERRLLATTAEDSNTTLHLFAINRAQTKSALVAAFKAWIGKQQDISGKESLRGRARTVAALRDLGCYRLMIKLDPLSRQAAMDEEGFKQSVPKLSEAKRRTEKRLQYLGYT